MHSHCTLSCLAFIWFFRLSSQPVLNLHYRKTSFHLCTYTNVWVITWSVASQEYIPPSSIIISMFLQITEFCLFISTNITNVINKIYKELTHRLFQFWPSILHTHHCVGVPVQLVTMKPTGCLLLIFRFVMFQFHRQ